MPWKVLDALTEEFEVEMVSEHDHRYWGFDTKEEETEFHGRMAKEGEDKFYRDVLNYVRGVPHELKAGTIGMIKADIAKVLVARDESLIWPDNRQQLLEAVKAVYNRDHSITVIWTPENRAEVDLMMARPNELPQG
jgi:hypothetical protein